MTVTRHLAKAGTAVWLIAVACLALLIAVVGFGGIGAGLEHSDLSLVFFGLSMAALSVTYFYHRRPDKLPMPRFALLLGAFGLICFLVAAYLARNIL